MVLDGVYGMFQGFRCLLKSQNTNDEVNSPGFLVRNNHLLGRVLNMKPPSSHPALILVGEQQGKRLNERLIVCIDTDEDL